MNTNAMIFVGAHPDDIEIGASGALVRYLNNDCQILYILATKGEKTFSATERYEDFQKLRVHLEQKNIKVKELAIPDGEISLHIPKVIEKLQDLFNSFAHFYDVKAAFIPYQNDTHQDHSALSQCCQAAFRFCPSIYQYPSFSSKGFVPNIFFGLTTAEVEQSKELLRFHKTELERFRNTKNSLEEFRSKMILHSSMVFNSNNAEGYYSEKVKLG